MDIRKRTAAKRFSIVNVFIIFTLVCCTSLLVRSTPPSQLEQVLVAGELRVLSRNGPTTFYEGSEGLTGFEYTLLQGFAKSLGVRITITEDDQVATIYSKFKSSDDKNYDVVSAGVNTKLRTSQNLRFTMPYMEVTQQVIFNSNQTAPLEPNDLINKKIVVLTKSVQLEQLRALQLTLPSLQWEEIDALEMTDLLDMIEQGQADYAVVDSAIYTLYRYSYPHTKMAFNLNTPQPVALALTQSRDDSLYDALQKYLNTIHKDGTLAQINGRFFEQMEPVNSDDAMMFSYRIGNRLKDWEEGLKTAANAYDVDWHLLAAISYQESHWDPKAESPTGVRGFMMLTHDTAKELGVSNREDPIQSIHGGAKYIKNLHERLPQRIQGEDRLYMALAAYNTGLGHLEDARVLTERMGGNPNLWADVSKHFPLLTKHQYFSIAKHGYVRGFEPVTYVQNVINYQKILTQYKKHEQFRMATSNTTNADAQHTEPTAFEKLSKNHLDHSVSLSIL